MWTWRIALVAVFALGLANGLWWTGHKAERWYVGQDSDEYRLLAHNLLDGRGFSRQHEAPFEPTMYREPGYPVFLVAVFTATGRSDQAVALVQSVLLGVSAVLAALLARSVFGDPRVGLLGGALTALSPDLGDHARYEMTEALFVPLFLLAALLSFRAWQRRTIASHAWGGLAFGLATYVRVMAAPTAAVLQGLLMLVYRREARRLLPLTLVMGGVILALMLPWIVRNAVEVESFGFAGRSGQYLMPRADKAVAPLDRQLRWLGLSAWVASYPLSEPVVPLSRLYKPPYLWNGPLGDWAHLESERSLHRYCTHVESPTPAQEMKLADECLMRQAQQMILTHPLQYVYMTPVEFARLNFYPYPSKLSLIHNWTIWAGVATIGVLLLRRRATRSHVWLMLFIAAYTLPSIVGDSLDRYGVPLYPFYALFAAAGAVGLLDRVLSLVHRPVRSAAPAATA